MDKLSPAPNIPRTEAGNKFKHRRERECINLQSLVGQSQTCQDTPSAEAPCVAGPNHTGTPGRTGDLGTVTQHPATHRFGSTPFTWISHGFTATFLLSCPATERTLAVGEGT